MVRSVVVCSVVVSILDADMVRSVVVSILDAILFKSNSITINLRLTRGGSYASVKGAHVYVY